MWIFKNKATREDTRGSGGVKENELSIEDLTEIINDEYEWGGTSNEIVYNSGLTLTDIVSQQQNQGKVLSQFVIDFNIDYIFLPDPYAYEDVLMYVGSELPDGEQENNF
ncbi:MAG: hypothetical protein U9R19_09225 [Bacteroidota bacterium]|nr:hypothetical protein [Bacteroidota bacterium]